MDFIGSLESWGGRLGVGLGFVLWGFSHGLFSIFGVRNWNFLGFADFGLSFWGAVCGGTVLDLVSSLWGAIDL